MIGINLVKKLAGPLFELFHAGLALQPCVQGVPSDAHVVRWDLFIWGYSCVCRVTLASFRLRRHVYAETDESRRLSVPLGTGGRTEGTAGSCTLTKSGVHFCDYFAASAASVM